MDRTPAQIDAEVQRLASRGLQAAAIWFSGRVKEVVSVPAPRTRVVSGPRSSHPGTVYYRATEEATPGAPPRKLSGRLRAGVGWQMVDQRRARVGGNVIYMRVHELGRHPFLVPTLTRELPRLATIIGQV